MKRLLSLTPALLIALSGLDASADDVTGGVALEDGDRIRAAQQVVALERAVQADPRSAALVKEQTEILKLGDRAARKTRIEKLAPTAAAIHASAFKSANLKPGDLEALLKAGGLKFTPPAPPPKPSGADLTPITITSFPTPFHWKSDCTEDGTYDFAGATAKTEAHAVFSTGAHGCKGEVRAGRAAPVKVPQGVKHMKVSVAAKVSMQAWAAHYGSYASAKAAFGVRVREVNDTVLATTPGPSPVALKVLTQPLKTISAKSFIPSPVPLDEASYSTDLQDGDANTEATFDIPSTVWGSTLEVGLYASSSADQTVVAMSNAWADVTPKSLKVVFTK